MSIASSAGRLSAGRVAIPKSTGGVGTAAAGAAASKSPPPMRIERLPSWTPSPGNTHILIRQGSSTGAVFKKATNMVRVVFDSMVLQNFLPLSN